MKVPVRLTSKFGLEGLTQTLAEELRPLGIRANSVDPGPMATQMRRTAYPTENQSQVKKPEDILDVFYYLASDESRHVTCKLFNAQDFQRD